MGISLRSVSRYGLLLHSAPARLHPVESHLHRLCSASTGCSSSRPSHPGSLVVDWRLHPPTMDGQEDQYLQYLDCRHQLPQCNFPSHLH